MEDSILEPTAHRSLHELVIPDNLVVLPRPPATETTDKNISLLLHAFRL